MATATALPKRADLDPAYTWNLESLFASDPGWESEFTTLEAALPSLEALQGTLGQDAESLLDALQRRDQIGSDVERLLVYAFMRRDENTANPTYQALAERMNSLMARYSKATAFFNPEILALDDATFEQFYAQAPDLEGYRFHLADVRRQKAHIRSAEVEAVLAQAGEVTNAPGTIFGMLNDADFKFPMIRDEEGNEIELTKGRYSLFLELSDPRVRREAFEAMYSVYSAHRNTLAATLGGAIRRDIFNAQVRGYGSSLEAALEPDSIPLAVYHNLIETVNRNLHLLHRYGAIRKRMLGLDELHMYDMYVPLTPGKPAEFTYDQAREAVAAALAPLGPDYAETLQRGLYSDRWIDVHENDGKRGGAYSWGAYNSQPFILLNWQDNINSMYTLAHELGHSMHSFFTRSAQPYVYGHYTIFVAEVASTCNEALLTDHLLKNTTDRGLKMQILNQQIDEIRGTLFRQTMFAEFELESHRLAEAGEAMTTERLSEIYRELVVRYHGPDLVFDEQLALEWSRIPHFYRAFYVYKYATGISAAMALSQQILSEGQPAVDRYLQFLKGGAAQTSIDLLKGAGVDMTTPQPIEQALAVFGTLLDQFEALLDAKDE